MSAETRKDIEAEIGRNGWKLIGKLAAVILGPLAVGGIAGAFAFSQWRGEINTAFESHVTLGGHPRMELRMNIQEQQAAVTRQMLVTINEKLGEIKNDLQELKDR